MSSLAETAKTIYFTLDAILQGRSRCSRSSLSYFRCLLSSEKQKHSWVPYITVKFHNFTMINLYHLRNWMYVACNSFRAALNKILNIDGGRNFKGFRLKRFSICQHMPNKISFWVSCILSLYRYIFFVVGVFGKNMRKKKTTNVNSEPPEINVLDLPQTIILHANLYFWRWNLNQFPFICLGNQFEI